MPNPVTRSRFAVVDATTSPHIELRAALEAIYRLFDIVEAQADVVQPHSIDLKAFAVRTQEKINLALREIG